jgi:hypothetical protein
MKRLWLALSLCLSCWQVHSSELDRFLTKVGGIDEPVYAVTVPFLAEHGSELDGKVVSVSGYLAVAKVTVLFATKESYETSDVANGVVIISPGNDARLMKMVEGGNHAFVRVFGVYSAKKFQLAEYGAMNAAGAVTRLIGVDPSYSPWGFSWPSPMEGSPKPRK